MYIYLYTSTRYLRFRLSFSASLEVLLGFEHSVDTPPKQLSTLHQHQQTIMPILHIVLFEWKPTTTHAQVVDVCHQLNNL